MGYEPRDRRDLGVDWPGRLIAVTVETCPSRQRARLRAIPSRLGQHGRVRLRLADRQQLNRYKERNRDCDDDQKRPLGYLTFSCAMQLRCLAILPTPYCVLCPANVKVKPIRNTKHVIRSGSFAALDPH